MASMCSAAAVRSRTGATTRRANRRLTAAASAVPTTHEPTSTRRSRVEDAVDAVERAGELDRADARQRRGEDAQVHAAVAVASENGGAGLPRAAASVAGVDRERASSPRGRRRVAVRAHELGEAARAAEARRRAPLARQRRRVARPHAGGRALVDGALRAQRVVDLAAQLARARHVGDERREHDGVATDGEHRQQDQAAREVTLARAGRSRRRAPCAAAAARRPPRSCAAGSRCRRPSALEVAPKS